MKWLKLLFYSLALAGIIATLTFNQGILDYFGPRLRSLEKAATEIAIKEISKNVSVPAPLRLPNKPSAANVLSTRGGTIQWTNTERINNGLQPLAENQRLDSIALSRLEDMFKNRYFAHVSPTGLKAEIVAQTIGYDYLALGENLALGNFDGDKNLVQAWMDSPGHRANILNAHYTEIGVAVKPGTFEGRQTWIGVQIFGKPASACPKPDADLKARIEAMEQELKDLRITLDIKRTEIENSKHQGRGYNEKVSEYNAMVEQYNSILAETKNLISQYNVQVSALNQCISS